MGSISINVVRQFWGFGFWGQILVSFHVTALSYLGKHAH